MHPQRLFLLYVVSNSGKRYWDCKLPSIEAQIELSSTFVYDQKIACVASAKKGREREGEKRKFLLPPPPLSTPEAKLLNSFQGSK